MCATAKPSGTRRAENTDGSTLGIRQSKALARRLAAEPFAALHSSELGRAAETVRLIAARTNQEIVFCSRLRERDFGVFNGLTDEESKEKYLEEYAARRADEKNCVIPGGESAMQYF